MFDFGNANSYQREAIAAFDGQVILNDIASHIVLIIHIGEFLYGDFLVSDGHKYFLVEFGLRRDAKKRNNKNSGNN